MVKGIAKDSTQCNCRREIFDPIRNGFAQAVTAFNDDESLNNNVIWVDPSHYDWYYQKDNDNVKIDIK